MSKEAWRFYFGDSTDEVDRYIWAYKPHFYRREPVFYDWQYTLGFLLSEALCERFEKFGSSACGANLRQVYLDSGVMTLQEFGKRHLGTDLTAGDFWQHAVNTALAPIDFCLANPDLFCRKNS